MTIAAVTTGVATALKAISGVENVHEDEHGVHESRDRIANGRVQFWEVSAEEQGAEDGLGWAEWRVQVRIKGWIGATDDEATDGSPGKRYAKELRSTVIRTLTASAQRCPGGSLGSDAPQPLPMRHEVVKLDTGEEPVCWVIEILWLVREE